MPFAFPGLGPILFLLYTADLIGLVTKHGLSSHLYADDTTFCGTCPPAITDRLQNQLSVCVGGVGRWMGANGLQLNADKTEFIWCGSQRRIGQLPNEPFVVCRSSVTPSTVWINMSSHISKTVAGCFATLRQLRSVRRSLSRDSFTRLVVALVLSRLDYCNGVLAGLPANQLNRLQSVLHVAAQLIYGAGQRDHMKPLLQRLHWLSGCLFLSVWSSSYVF